MGAYSSGLVKNARISMKSVTIMNSCLFTTENNTEWDKKMKTGLLKEIEALTGTFAESKLHSIYIKRGDVFAGSMSMKHHNDILWIDSIWVEPGFRKQGFGTRLLQEALLFATQNEIKEIQLNTYFPEAHVFFLTCGFEDVAKIPHWKWGLDCYLMRKKV